MKQYKWMLCLILFLFNNLLAQQPINEEKVNKAAAIMKKIISNPDQMMSLYQEMQALKLTPAEEKEAQKRAQQEAMKQANEIKEKAVTTGGKTEQQIKQVREENKRIVPLRDESRINSVVKRMLNDAEIKTYCKAVHEAVKKQMLPQAVEQAEKIFTQIKSKTANSGNWGKEAIAVYFTNLTQQSLYIMGRVCSETNADANTLNNYAALLNGVRMEHGSIPILNYLRTKYGASPPVMNNLAMAWLGLGEFQKAGKIADTVIQRYPGRRGQAHYVKSIIKEGEGDRNGAIEEMKKSMDESYSAVKESILRKWNAGMKSSDYKGNPAGDVLGLNKFEWPAFPKSYEEVLVLYPQWKKYKDELQAVRYAFETKEKQLREKYIEPFKKINTVSFTGFAAAANNNTNQRMAAYYNSFSEDYAEADRELLDEIEIVKGKIKVMTKEMERQKKAVDEKYKNFCGEGQKCPEQEICEAEKKVYDAFLEKANEQWRMYFERANSIRKRFINHLLYGARYSMDEDYFQIYKLQMQTQYLAFLESFTYETTANVFQIGPQPLCIGNPKTNPFKGLSDFDAVNCNNKWQMTFPGGHELSTECNKLTFKLNLILASVARTEDLFTGEWSEYEIESGLDISSKHWMAGAVEAGVEGGVFVKIDRTGINDFGVKASAGIKAGSETIKVGNSNVPLSVKVIEAGGKISMVSGKTEVEVSSDFASSKIEYK